MPGSFPFHFSLFCNLFLGYFIPGEYVTVRVLLMLQLYYNKSHNFLIGGSRNAVSLKPPACCNVVFGYSLSVSAWGKSFTLGRQANTPPCLCIDGIPLYQVWVHSLLHLRQLYLKPLQLFLPKAINSSQN